MKQKQRFRLRKHSSPIMLLPFRKWKGKRKKKKVLKCQKLCCLKLKYSLHFTWSRQKKWLKIKRETSVKNKCVFLNWTVFSFGILGFDSRWKNINKQKVPWVTKAHTPLHYWHALLQQNHTFLMLQKGNKWLQHLGFVCLWITFNILHRCESL